MIIEKLINDANEKDKSLSSENKKKLWYCIYILICVSIVLIFGIILLYFIFKFKNNFEHRKKIISPSMTLLH
jgi:heme/copper-type cytochrome/quinol oxidase subunit 2